ncbi:glycerophosphodiester phosphodiesterase [Phragmitibacter flavus]|uniref:Glycerophosphodiester phosphodiesterase n=1 Tax=Phragmitibacter flavus TaxID=2576071 RepID=A0A5R8K8S4_9BACT|nr:glycerophosphodiester phosphodiesterase family protein [Phragmitibacter flavus]TLD68734.1 glycerophosphodiester phosphodiesterase [Phragmitibacter flavus]
MMKVFVAALLLVLFGGGVKHATATEIIAHRGFSLRAPENTVAALNLAWEHKADACEFDILLSADGQMVLMHDKDTLKTGGKPGLVVAQTAAADLFKLDVGSWKGETWKGERVPTLTQALATLPVGHQRAFIEIKCGVEIVPALQRELEGMRLRAKQLVVMCFERAVVAEVKEAMPWLKVYRLSSAKDKQRRAIPVERVIEESREDGLDGISLSKDFPWSDALVKKVKDAGMELYVWTVNDPALASLVAKAGVDGIITDDPVMVRELLEK